MVDEKGRELAAKLYDCIGRAMADLVTRGIPAAKRLKSPGGDRWVLLDGLRP